MSPTPRPVSRRLWALLEPVHAVAYFAPEVPERLTACGQRGFWMGYFGARAAPMGGVAPAVVEATFFGFHPAMVRRAIPDAWRFASPDAIGAARDAGVDAALRRILGPHAESDAVAEAATLAEAAAAACDCSGRPLAAAWQARPGAGSPRLRLWLASSVLREHRGDGHVLANVAAGVDGLESHVLQAARGAVPRDWLQRARGWGDADWDAAAARLEARGWLVDGALSAAGREARAAVEARTDALAAGPWAAVGPDATERLAVLLAPLAGAVADSGDLPFPNPIGVPRPPGRDAAVTAAHDAAVASGRDGYLDPETGSFVFTAAALAAKGACCGSGCRHCPYPEEDR
jgi:hypothetical protein